MWNDPPPPRPGTSDPTLRPRGVGGWGRSGPTHRVRAEVPGRGGLIGLACRVVLMLLMAAPAVAEIDPQSGLVIDTGFEQVRSQCMACHSTRLVAQNRSTREGWLQMIRWMQDTQGLWPLGDAEPVILDYLAKNYGPLESGRRRPLEVTFDE